MASDPLTATAKAIERAFGVPARTVRHWGQHGTVTRHDSGRYDVREVLARQVQRTRHADHSAAD